MSPFLEEIRLSNFSLTGDKASGPGSFSMVFFQHCWDIVKEDLISPMREFQKGGAHLRGINKTLLVLNP